MRRRCQQPQRLNWAVIIGHVVECFDASIYGFYAVLLAPFFFPPDSEQVRLSLLAFSAGFWLRPIGGVFFGFIADRFGRRAPLMISMALVGIPTLVIGILPEYSRIGIWAPIILFFCRALQGFFYGAEFAGASVYTYENHAHTNQVGSKVGILLSAGTMGAVFATALGALCTMSIMPAWAWRIPFIIGGLSALFVFLLRKNLQETRSFEEASSKQSTLSFPTQELWKRRKTVFFATIIFSLNTVPFYLITVFGNQMFQRLGYTPPQSMLLNMNALIFDAVMILYWSRLADRIGARFLWIVGCSWVMAIALPSFWGVTHFPSTSMIFIFMFLISLGHTMLVATSMSYVSSLFPTICRFSAIALSTTLGYGVIAGNTPYIADFLRDHFQSNLAPSFWLLITCGAALLCVFQQGRKERHSPQSLDFAARL